MRKIYLFPYCSQEVKHRGDKKKQARISGQWIQSTSVRNWFFNSWAQRDESHVDLGEI